MSNRESVCVRVLERERERDWVGCEREKIIQKHIVCGTYE